MLMVGFLAASKPQLDGVIVALTNPKPNPMITTGGYEGSRLRHRRRLQYCNEFKSIYA